MTDNELRSLIVCRVLEGLDFDADFILLLEPENGNYQEIGLEEAQKFFNYEPINTLTTSCKPLNNSLYIQRLREIGIKN